MPGASGNVLLTAWVRAASPASTAVGRICATIVPLR